MGVSIEDAEDVVIAAPLPRLALGAGDDADQSRTFRVLREDDLGWPKAEAITQDPEVFEFDLPLTDDESDREDPDAPGPGPEAPLPEGGRVRSGNTDAT